MDERRDDETRNGKARRRALRAAQVVTLGLALAGCSAAHEPPPPMPGEMADAAIPLPDAGAADGNDAALADAGVDCWEATDWEACCNEHAWDPNAGCLAWGPYVPPGATMPPSRSGRA